ncbi:ComEC/Rec2 family competence protein [Hymenobacter monticola]|uniref:Metallo-beta-lactamase domain-containing protein n=1 Tax=Hymenobacter monticola TaxID=1705399 RepID=A0ABY4BEA7_9BACT|nr:hypothetical protein [Hymenobacter monticola]UOE34975.1 hypothetical protein MTP16_04820 [Hymenobacter monticola]
MPALNGDGNLYLTFADMGQGDCTMVSLPNGKTLMVDCGTSRWDTKRNAGAEQSKEEHRNEILDLRQAVVNMLFEPRFMHANNRLDALVLTHPDKDHCSELQNSLMVKSPAIGAVYFSFNDLTKYAQGGAGKWLRVKANVANYYNITLNLTARTINNVAIPEEPATLPAAPNRPTNVRSRSAGTRGFVRILDGTKAGGKNCEVFILASNVVPYPGVQDNSTDRNRGSIVTLIVFGSKRIMLCGDATFNTEKFLKDTYGANIANLELLQLPHHSSMTSSSWADSPDDNINAIDFVGHVKPRRIIITASIDSGERLQLPRYEVIKRYMKAPNQLLAADRAVHAYLAQVTTYVPKGSGGKRTRDDTESEPYYYKRRLLVDIVSTGTLGAVDYAITDAEA